MKLEIENIKPFNDIFFINCFYNSLFPIIELFGLEIDHFLINAIPTYCITSDEEVINFQMTYKELSPFHEICLNLGVFIETHQKVETNFESFIIKSIQENKPIIMWIDCYYESIRSDTYLREHLPHTIVIYGYDSSTQLYSILEHDHKDNLTYTYKQISLEDLTKSYQGYLENFYVSENPTVFQFYGRQSNEINGNSIYFKDKYLKNFQHFSKDVIKGLEDIKKFARYYETLIREEKAIKDKCLTLIDFLNKIVISKQFEKYRAERILRNSYVIELIELIIQKYNRVRSVVAKYLYSSRYSFEKFSFSVEVLKEIIDLEYMVYQEMGKEVNLLICEKCMKEGPDRDH
ncbi:BtrH N-terminal domain-containing protein [Paenibacillus polysaccharolyticus]|uniref:BtrH N-terminal domain-containing protein n=1 Tax=Paenibacillus polysaccharolyticus TaxID=582692 RepID=UPI00203EDE61|nr:BtrH N-terminal domain-containing protein [Paenibacillus polysaccharolyticus]MCM3135809.1 BtrH N-terminal domain-containing protein [Paenibacillus polysaccharolyticus]